MNWQSWRIECPNANGNNARVFIDGEDVSGALVAFELRARVGERVELVLHITPREIIVNGRAKPGVKYILEEIKEASKVTE